MDTMEKIVGGLFIFFTWIVAVIWDLTMIVTAAGGVEGRPLDGSDLAGSIVIMVALILVGIAAAQNGNKG